MSGHPAFDSRHFAELRRAAGVGLGDPFTARDQTESTMDDALSAARAGAPHGATFFAEQQTRGRGRRGDRWICAPREGLTFSVLLRPAHSAPHYSAFGLAAGLAVRDAVALWISEPAWLKWPNDVLAAGKKLAGVLVESQFPSGGDPGCETRSAMVVGIGVNVHTTEFPESISRIATSLNLLDAGELPREKLLVSLLSALERRFTQYESFGFSGMSQDFERYDALRDRSISVDGEAGMARGIDPSGALRFEAASGKIRLVHGGSVLLSPGD
jgi:BirA family biotin operon repressor/biotin-[acetyl-CoA-carboxylase] ligase